MRLVALSGYAAPDDRRRALEAGFDAHVPKPASLDHLLRRVWPHPIGAGSIAFCAFLLISIQKTQSLRNSRKDFRARVPRSGDAGG